ncbi:MAG: GspH/FimT family pseudopilin [Rhodoferax sp.]|nr:GspH/FimT family pseudopilin [Rhodoferax sp.]
MKITFKQLELPRHKGFTLIELMVVVSIVAIVAAIAIPSWNNLIVSNRIRAAVNDWISSTQFARSEALRQNMQITLCPSSDGIQCTATDYETGWIVRTDGTIALANRVLQDTLPKQGIKMTPESINSRIVNFMPNGRLGTNAMLPGGYTAHITVRDDPPTNDSLTRHICIPRTGRIKVYTAAQYSSTACGG